LAFIRDDEVSQLRIANMILHVVDNEEFRPEPARIVEHADFFIERIRNTDVEPVFAFDANSQVKAQLERMAQDADPFEAGGQALSREFARFHHGGSRDGAFFIFDLRTDDPDVRIYSLIKYDYQQVVEQHDENGAALLRLIVQAFVADRRAIQKAALVRVVKGVAETAISARDRMKSAPEIGDYFANYLHVTRTRSDQQLNQKAVEAVSNALKELRDLLPNRDVPAAFREAKAALGARQQIDEDAIQEAILAAAGSPDDELVRGKIQACVRRKLKAAKLEGLAFPSDRNQLRIPAIRRLRTTEGVLMFYPDRVAGSNVERRPTANGGEIITITTRHVEEDGIVHREPRSAA
jgi:hypothetical protein